MKSFVSYALNVEDLMKTPKYVAVGINLTRTKRDRTSTDDNRKPIIKFQ